MKFFVLVFLTFLLPFEALSGSKQVVPVNALSEIGQSLSDSEIAVYISSSDTQTANALLSSTGWIPSSVRQQIQAGGHRFLVAATRFKVTRRASTLGTDNLLSVDELESVCGCDLDNISRPSGSVVSFSSVASRAGVTVESSSYIRHYPQSKYSTLTLGEGFLSRYMGVNPGSSAIATYQVSWDFSRIFSTSQVYSFFFPLGNGKVEIVSVSLSIFKNGVNGIMRSLVAGQVERDLLRVARQAEKNGR